MHVLKVSQVALWEMKDFSPLRIGTETWTPAKVLP